LPTFWLKSAPGRTTRRGNRDRELDPSEVFSGRHLFTSPNGQMAFLDAAGACPIPVQHDPPINPMLDDQTTMGVHHAFATAHDDYQAALDHLRARGVEITFREDRQGGLLNGPRIFSRSRGHGVGVYRLHELLRPVLRMP
jgi:hypothetical protein